MCYRQPVTPRYTRTLSQRATDSSLHLGTDENCHSVLPTAHYTSVQTNTATECYRQPITPRYRRTLSQRATGSSLHLGTREHCYSVLLTAHYTSVQTNTVTACYRQLITACYRQLITPRYRRTLLQRATDSSLHLGPLCCLTTYSVFMYIDVYKHAYIHTCVRASISVYI